MWVAFRLNTCSGFFREPALRACRSSRSAQSDWPSISGQPERLASRCRRPCACARTKSLSDSPAIRQSCHPSCRTRVSPIAGDWFRENRRASLQDSFWPAAVVGPPRRHDSYRGVVVVASRKLSGSLHRIECRLPAPPSVNNGSKAPVRSDTGSGCNPSRAVSQLVLASGKRGARFHRSFGRVRSPLRVANIVGVPATLRTLSRAICPCRLLSSCHAAAPASPHRLSLSKFIERRPARVQSSRRLPETEVKESREPRALRFTERAIRIPIAK